MQGSGSLAGAGTASLRLQVVTPLALNMTVTCPGLVQWGLETSDSQGRGLCLGEWPVGLFGSTGRAG
mgnify:CR=1 FL=1